MAMGYGISSNSETPVVNTTNYSQWSPCYYYYLLLVFEIDSSYYSGPFLSAPKPGIGQGWDETGRIRRVLGKIDLGMGMGRTSFFDRFGRRWRRNPGIGKLS
jgi:hypothetical protein